MLLARAENQPNRAVEEALIQALDQRISAYDGGDGMDLAALLALPGMAELEALQPGRPLALDRAFREWTQELGVQLQASLRRLLELARADWSLAWPAGQGAVPRRRWPGVGLRPRGMQRFRGRPWRRSLALR